MAHQQQFCTFSLEGLFFGVEVQRVQEVIRYQEMTRIPLAPRVVRGLMNLRGQIVTAIDLRRRLGLPERASQRQSFNVVLRDEGAQVSLLVDEIGDVLDVEASAFEPAPQTLQGPFRELVLGAYKLDARLLLVLDTDRATAPEHL